MLGAAPAWGHAVLVGTDPSDGAQLDQPPTVVELGFNETVEVPVGGVRVFDSTGQRVDLGDAGSGGSPNQARVTLGDLSDGIYVVTWRVVSADSHPVRGAFLFQVGEGAQVDETLLEALLGEGEQPGYAAAAWLLRVVTYGGALVAVGAVIFMLIVARALVPSALRLIRIAAVVAIGGSVLQIPVLAVEATGLGLSALTSAEALGDAFTSSLAAASLIRSASLVVLVLALGRGMRGWAGWGAAGVVVSGLVTGHTRTIEPAWLMMSADALHVTAAAAWVGGLVALVMVLRSASHPEDMEQGAAMVRRFSAMALWFVVALAVGGLAMASVTVGAPRAVTSTAYGWTLVAKTSLVVLILGMAAYNNRVLVPAVTRDNPSPGGGVALGTRQVAWLRLRRTVGFELVGLTLVVAVTAALVNVQPAALAAGVSGPYATTVAFGEMQLDVVVDPNRAGQNEVHLFVLTPGGLPALVTGEASIEFYMPAEDIGPIIRPLQVAGPAHFLYIGPELAIPGEWVVTVRSRLSQFDEVSVDIPVVVNP